MMIEPNVIDFALTSLESFAKHLKKEKYISLNLLFITETITLFWGFEMIILYYQCGQLLLMTFPAGKKGLVIN